MKNEANRFENLNRRLSNRRSLLSNISHALQREKFNLAVRSLEYLNKTDKRSVQRYKNLWKSIAKTDEKIHLHKMKMKEVENKHAALIRKTIISLAKKKNP